MTRRPPLRVVELTRGVAGAVCGRLFAGFGDEVVALEPPGGSPLRRRPPLGPDGIGLGFVALNADKDLVEVSEDATAAALGELLDGADLLILDLVPAEAERLGVDEDGLRRRWPGLIVVWITAFGRDTELRDLPEDSLLAESYGGLATMLGTPDRRPLSLGGQQIAHCAAITGFLGAMASLLRRDQGHGGDLVEVAMCDVAAYVDWKSDVGLHMSGHSPRRTGMDGAEWKLIRARDGWVGAIFQHRHWPAMQRLVDHPALRDPDLADERTRLTRAVEWWPVVDEWAAERSAQEIYDRAQSLGLPFGWAVKASDLLRSPQLRGRGFIAVPSPAAHTAPVLGSPVFSADLSWRSGSPRRTTLDAIPTRHAPVEGTRREDGASGPLEGLVVLDFGTITAGAAATRLLADFGATVVKVESADRPDVFRSWKVPAPEGEAPRAVDAEDSPYFPSNNIGKLSVALDLKTVEGRRIVRRLARRSHVVVENFRVGVTERLGIDEPALRAVNPALLYLSLSSQGQHGPESRNGSFGSTLDLLSGLASLTGYDEDRPLWSSSDVNYPDQLVSLLGAAFVVSCVARGITGVHLDCSQREVVSWTLAAEIAAFTVAGEDFRITGNRRPGRTPHDTYRTAEPDGWIAVFCSSDQERAALAACIGADALANEDIDWWLANEDRVDSLIEAWSLRRTRAEAASELRAAGVAAVPVLDAGDRARVASFAEHGVTLSVDGIPVKGLPMRFREYCPSLRLSSPRLGRDTDAVLREWTGLSDAEMKDLEASGAIYRAPDRRVGIR